MMKTLRIAAVAAAVLIGVAAHAQSNRGTADDGSVSGIEQQQPATSGSGQYCLQKVSDRTLSCRYASLTACQRDARTQRGSCRLNPTVGTTGSK